MTETGESDWDQYAPEVLADQIAAYDRMRRQCPVAYDVSGNWAVFRHADVVRVLDEHHTFSNVVSRHVAVPNGMDPPQHTAFRAIVAAKAHQRLCFAAPKERRVAVVTGGARDRRRDDRWPPAR